MSALWVLLDLVKLRYLILIERMYEIESGDIKYGLESVYDIPLSKWRRKMDMLCNQIR